MKKIICLTAFLAVAAMTLTACSDTSQSGIIQGSRGSGSSTSSSVGTSSSSSKASSSTTKISDNMGGASSSSSSSSAEQSSSEPQSSSKPAASSRPQSSTPDKPPVQFIDGEIADGKLEEGKIYTVKNGETLRIGNGQSLLVNGRLLCNNGGNIVVERGGELMVNGEIELSGNLQMLGNMSLSEDAKVYGEGSMSLNSFNDIDCHGSFKAKIIPPEPKVVDGVTYVGDVLIVNKKIDLPKTYGTGLSSELQNALQKMRNASGYSMPIISGYRSYEYQVGTFQRWCDKDGEEVASTYSARPGHSEHQTGLAADITSIYQSYGDTTEGKWVAAHSYEYGLIIRYPEGKDDITGYMYEPWHLRYLGESTARLVHDSGLTLDEFLGVES